MGKIRFILTSAFKGEILRATGHYLKEQGYSIKVLDLTDVKNSDRYNPLRYLRDEVSVITLTTNLIRNTTPKKSGASDPFWEKSETALLQALIFYLLEAAPEEEQNFGTIMEMLSFAEVKENDEDYESPLDMLFNEREAEDPDSIAVRQYKVYKLAAGVATCS